MTGILKKNLREGETYYCPLMDRNVLVLSSKQRNELVWGKNYEWLEVTIKFFDGNFYNTTTVDDGQLQYLNK